MIKIRTARVGDITEVKCLMSHPMETGLRKDAKTGQTLPAHYITQVTATLNGKLVMQAQWGGGIAMNPYLAFRLKGARSGDKLVVSWLDNTGASSSGEAVIG
jgi:sulfur-oxidizing protein SoxZ